MLRPWMLLPLLAVVALGACQSTDPVAIDAARTVEQEAQFTRGRSSAPPLNVDSILESELARIAARQEAEAAIEDSLKVIWQQVLDDTTGRYADSLVCDPKQYVGTATIVGPEGGDIDFGEHKLRIPRGALSVRTVITAEAPTSLRVTSVFSPHGTQFNPNARPTLELSYKHCRAPNRPARIAYVGANGQILEWPPSQDFRDEEYVRGLIAHFSNYIVAY